MDNNSKPFILVMNEAEQKLTDAVNDLINNEGIPCYFIELLFDKIHRRIKDGASHDIERAGEIFKAKQNIPEESTPEENIPEENIPEEVTS